MDFKEKLEKKVKFINTKLEKELKDTNCPEGILNESMSYSLTAGGKRLRPILMLETYKLFKNDIEEAIPFAVAMEMVHTFSLKHC